MSTPIIKIILDVKKDFDATYYESSDGSEKLDENMIQNLIEDNEFAIKIMSTTRSSSQSRQAGRIYSYDSDNIKYSVKPPNTNANFQIDIRRKNEVESRACDPNILKGQHLLSDKNVVALKLCLKEFDLTLNELGNHEKDDQHKSHDENKNKKTKTNKTPIKKEIRKEKRYLTNDMINEIIRIMPQTYDDLPAALQKENLPTQHRLLIFLYNFLEQYDILHLFPILNSISNPETSIQLYPSNDDQAINEKNDSGVMMLVNGVWSPTTNRKRNQYGKIKTPDGSTGFDKSNIQTEIITNANERNEALICVGSNIDKKSKSNPVEVLDCSNSEGVRIDEDTVTMKGVGVGTEIMVAKKMSEYAEEEKEKEKEKEKAKGNEKQISVGSRLKEGFGSGLGLGLGLVTRGKTIPKGDRGGLDVENIHVNLRQPFRSTTMFSKNTDLATAGPMPAAAAVPLTASSSSSFLSSTAATTAIPSSSSSSTSTSSSSSSSSSSSRAAAASLSSSSSSSSGAIMRRGMTVINPPKGPPSYADSTLQRRNTVAGSVRTRTGTPTLTGLGRGIGADIKLRTEIGKDGGKYVAKCVEIVRKKSERESLPGHKCTECAAFYKALQQQGIVSEDGMGEMLQRCSRHKVWYLGFVTDITECTV